MKGVNVFYTLVITQTISLVGSRMTAIGVGIWVFTETRRAAPLLLAAFFAELPGMLAGSLAGIWVDRWERRHVLILADVGQALGAVFLLLSFQFGQFEIWHLYLVALLQGAFAAFQQPAEEAVTTLLVVDNHRERANAIQQIAFPLAGVIAPAVTGILFIVTGVSGIILIDLATFLVAVGALFFIRLPDPKPTEEGLAARGNIYRELKGGCRFLTKRRPLLYFVLYLAFINFLLNGPLELAIPYLISVTGNEVLAGGLLGLMSLGALSGAILIAIWGGTRPRMHTLMPGLLLAGSMFLVFGTARSPIVLGTALFLLMVPLPVMNALHISILQVKTPPDMQGRIFSIVAQLGFIGSTSSFLLTGHLVDRYLEPAVGSPNWFLFEPLVGNTSGAGIGLLLFVIGLIIIASTLVMYGWPRIRTLELALPDYEPSEV